MKQTEARARYSQRRLEKLVGELISMAKDLCPEAQIEVQIPGYGEFDPWMRITVPDEKEEEVDDALSQRAHDISMETDYEIGVWVMERSRVSDGAAVKS